MSLRVCGEPGCPVLVRSGKCKDHEVLQPTRRLRTASEQRRRADTVTAWVEANGWLCPGWQRPPHEDRDLTAAHRIAAAHGGNDGPLDVLCRRCNGAQGVDAAPWGEDPPSP